MKMMTVGVVVSLATLAAFGQGKENFLQQQAYAEMQRVSGQVDVLQNNFDDLARRVAQVEGSGDVKSLRDEVAALKGSIAELRREMQEQRNEIVKDLAARIAKMQPPPAPRQSAAPARSTYSGPTLDYVVQSGDTLSLISTAFKVPIKEIKEMNGLKSDMLRVGQKLVVPKK